jgi:two-component system OmpR family response regulator
MVDDPGDARTRTERTLHVLVVDDNRDAADSLCWLLKMWGYDCRAVYDGLAGLEEARTYRPDCLVLDIAMPRMDGYTLAQQIRRLPGLERTKLVALTAYSDEEHTHQVKESGFDFHLVKPADLLELERILHMLDEVVKLASRTEELARQNVELASETRDLLKEVKDDIQEIKEEVKELKEDLHARKEEDATRPDATGG